MSQRCVDIAQPRYLRRGGLTEVKRIVALAKAFQTNVIPHKLGHGASLCRRLAPGEYA